MARRPVSIPDIQALDWQPISTADGNVPGPVAKPLTDDPETGAATFLLHTPPGWGDPKLDFHPTEEESFRLGGTTYLGDRVLTAGNYLYRPPNILHGPVHSDAILGATGIARFSRPMRILYYEGDEHPHRDCQPLTDQHEDWPLAWHERLDPETLPWEEAPAGPWAGARYRWLNRHRDTGGGAIQLQLPAGFAGAGTAARSVVEEFVFRGLLEADGVTYGEWGYACRAAGAPAGEYRTGEGCLLVCWWETDELV